MYTSSLTPVPYSPILSGFPVWLLPILEHTEVFHGVSELPKLPLFLEEAAIKAQPFSGLRSSRSELERADVALTLSRKEGYPSDAPQVLTEEC